MILTVKKVNKILFLLMLITYMLNASIYSLPSNDYLRWIVIILFFIWVFFFNTKHLHIPKKIVLLLIPYIATIRIIFDRGIAESILRSSSFFIFIITMIILFDKSNAKQNREYILIFGKVLGLCTKINFTQFIFENNFGNFMGIYFNKNYLSTVLIASSVFDICFLKKSKYYKRCGVILFFFNSIMIFATGSRAALICWLLVVLTIPLVFIDNWNLKSALKFIILFIIVIFICVIVMENVEIPALSRLFGNSKNNSTGFTRGDIWFKAIPIFLEKPIFGWGNNIVYLNINHLTGIGNSFDWGFHNSFLVLLCESGIIGIVSFLLFLKDIFTRNSKFFFKSIECRFSIILIVLLLVNATSEAFLFAVGNFASICFWIPVAYLMVHKFILEERV